MSLKRASSLACLCVAALIGAGSAASAQNYKWEGTAPFCDGECGPGEIEIGRSALPVGPLSYYGANFGSACATGSKALCQFVGGRAACHWSGTAPFCKGGCNRNEVAANPLPGASSGHKCLTGHKVFCCSR